MIIGPLFLPPLLYAEVHYRIAGMFSRYFKREPEIVADAPLRVRAGKHLPVAVIIKDAHRYPIELTTVTVHLRHQSGARLYQRRMFREKIDRPMWHTLLFCPLPDDAGALTVEVEIEYRSGKKRRTCISDNYRLTSHRPFNVQIDDLPWPRATGWYFGETHSHTHLSSDQVEFGAPPEVTLTMARAQELDFVALTDHSYDLDDRPDNFLIDDPNLPKWRELWKTVETLNARQHDVVLIAGEELSAGNLRGQNVHLLIYNNRRFFHGSGDGAERWLRTRPEHRIDEVLPTLEPQASAIAAHPLTEPPMLQKLLLRRGRWHRADLTVEGLSGAQFWNGDKEAFLRDGLPQWIELLLKGGKVTLIAGNDAHGSFNRFRQIGTPHFSMREEQRELFGEARTGVLIDGEISVTAIVQAIQAGRVICTDGPFIDGILHTPRSSFRIGDTAAVPSGELEVQGISSPAFGAILRAEAIIGDCAAQKETRRPLTPPSGSSQFIHRFKVDLPSRGYLRLEIETQRGEQHFHGFTNPIYLSPTAA